MSGQESDSISETAAELVIHTQLSDAKPLDAYVSKLADYAECQISIEFWKKRLKRLKAELAEVLGEAEVGTVNGEPVLFYSRKESFQSQEFAKQYPDFYRLYSRDITKKQFDAAWLKDERPDLYREFQVRAMRNTFNA